MVMLGEELIRAIKKAVSQYTVSITGAVSIGSIEKIK
jgi:predicted DNA-binding protein with PD1-like motif